VAAAFSPLDEELALPAGQLSPFLLESVVRLASWMPFARAVAEVAWCTGTTVSATTVRRRTEAAGGTYEAVQTEQVATLEREAPAAAPGPAVQVLSVDGVMVPLVGGVWAEVKTLALGTVEARTAGSPHRPQREVRTVDLSYFSRMTDHKTFTRLALVETQRRGTETAGRVCGVCDGARWNQEFLDHHRPDAVRILDWPHAVSYVAAVAKAVYGEGTPAAKAWLAQQKETLLHGDPALLLADLACLQTALGAVADGSQERFVWTLPGARAADPPLQGMLGQEVAQQAVAVVDDSRQYLQDRQAQVQYAAFRAAHYPIGSGSVESANKLLVQARLKGAGMRWAPASVNPMVALRTVAYSDRWEEAWPRITATQRCARQAQTTQRRTVRQEERARLAAEERARLAAEQARAATATAPPLSPPRTPARPPAPPARARSRKPAPDHPWRRPVVSHPRSA
jgi:hypothetical protein